MKHFATHFNDQQAIDTALQASKADILYSEAAKAFDKGDMQATLDYFFQAIHCRYDIERPSAKRLIRRKLNVVNQLRAEVETLRQEKEGRSS